MKKLYEYLKERHGLHLMTEELVDLRDVVLDELGICPVCNNTHYQDLKDGTSIPCTRCTR